MANNKRKTDQWLNAALTGDAATIDACLDGKINVDVAGQDGRTALMNAAGSGHSEMVRKLIAAKAKVNAKSNSGKDALIYAVAPDWAGLFKGRAGSDGEGVVKALLAGGAQVSIDHLVTVILSCDKSIVAALVKANRGAIANAVTVQAAVATA